MNIELLMTLTMIHTVVLTSRGPDFALQVKLTSQESRKVAIATATGIAALKSAQQVCRDKYTDVVVANPRNQLTMTQGFMQGLYTNLLNPKAMLFLLTLSVVVYIYCVAIIKSECSAESKKNGTRN